MSDNRFTILSKEVETLAQKLALTKDPTKRVELLRHIRVLIGQMESSTKRSDPSSK
jgi:hypothetical protein